MIMALANDGISIVASHQGAPVWLFPVGVVLTALGALIWYRRVQSNAASAAQEAPPTTLRMAPVDAAWLHMDEPDNPADVILLMTFDESPILESVKATVARRLLRFDRFRQRVVEIDGQPHWESDGAFEIGNHVLAYDINGALTAERLAGVVSELGSGGFAAGRPLWSLHVVKGTDGTGALVLRVHHCLGDGLALAHAVSFPERSADEPTAAGREPGRGSSRVVRVIGLARSLSHTLLIPFGRARVLRAEVTGRRRMAWSAGFSLDMVKTVARSHHVTLNDVVLATLSGALRRFLAERGELAMERSVRAVVPANLRPVRWVEDVDDALENRFGLFFIDLPVEAATMRARLSAVKERMRAGNRLAEAAVVFGLLNVLGRGPAIWERFLTSFFLRKASVVVSNVPGPRAPVCFGGKQVREVMFWEPHPGPLGTAISILTYAGTIRMGTRVDEGVTDDPKRLVALFEEELSAVLDGSS